MPNHEQRGRFSWMLYDWANSAFAVTVISGFFPLFFKQYWSTGTPVTTSTFYLGLGNSAASLVIVLAAPILGALADHGGRRKRMLASLASVGILATSALFFVQQGSWAIAICLFFFGIVGFSGANIFYDSLLLAVTGTSDRHRVSAAGYAMGYLGGGLLFLVNVMMTLKPDWFGLAGTAEAVRWSFISVAIWWAVFSIPLLIWVPEPPVTAAPKEALLKPAFSSVWSTLNSIRKQRNAWLFLLSYWLYIDGVATIIRMAVDYGLSIGLPANSLITALLLVQFIGFPATLLFGRLGERIGAKRGLWIGLWVYVIATTYAVFMDSSIEFYILAVALGLVQGGVQSLSRSLFSHLIPVEKNGEYFGFLNMMGKAAAVVGPVLVGFIAYLTDDPRLGIWSILILFFAGMWLLRYVHDPLDDR